MNLLEGLNDMQQKAVQTINGPLLILAGPAAAKPAPLSTGLPTFSRIQARSPIAYSR